MHMFCFKQVFSFFFFEGCKAKVGFDVLIFQKIHQVALF